MKERFDLMYEADNIEIGYSESMGIMYCDWIGVQLEDQLKLSGEKILELLLSKRCKKVLNDNTRVIGHWYHSVDWTMSDWFPRMEDAGLKHFAWICSDDVFTNWSAKRAVPKGNLVKAFDNYEEAYAWLRSQ